MARNSRKRTVKVKRTFTVAAAGWSVQAINDLGLSGRVTRCVVRMEAGGVWTAAEVRLINGLYDTSQDPATVPDEDLAYEETGIVLAGSATVADSDTNVESTTGGAFYDRSNHGTEVADDLNLLLALNVTAGGPGSSDITVTLYATDVE